MSTENQEVQKFLILGSTLSKEREEEIMKVLAGFTTDVRVIKLVPQELNNIVEKRMEMAQEDDAVKFLENDRERGQARMLALQMQEHVKADPTGFYDKKYFKSFTNLSWGQFNKALDTLKLFKFAEEHPNNTHVVRFIVSEEDVEQATLRKIQRLTDELKTEIKLSYPAIKDKDVKEELYRFKRKLSLKVKNGFR